MNGVLNFDQPIIMVQLPRLSNHFSHVWVQDVNYQKIIQIFQRLAALTGEKYKGLRAQRIAVLTGEKLNVREPDEGLKKYKGLRAWPGAQGLKYLFSIIWYTRNPYIGFNKWVI